MPNKIFKGMEISPFVKSEKIALQIPKALPDWKQYLWTWLMNLSASTLANKQKNKVTSRDLGRLVWLD
jgi:hypothetical protein